MAGVILVLLGRHEKPMRSHNLSGMVAHQDVRAYILYLLHMHTLVTISDTV